MVTLMTTATLHPVGSTVLLTNCCTCVFTGVDGKRLLRIDGPHSSPSQHFDAYHHTMLVGAGIGMTPCASILRGALKYKWRKGYDPKTLQFMWLVRHNEIASFQWFVSLLSRLISKVQRDKVAGTIGADYSLQVHIFVTGFNPRQSARRPDSASIASGQAHRVSMQHRRSSDVDESITVPVGREKQVRNLSTSPILAFHRCSLKAPRNPCCNLEIMRHWRFLYCCLFRWPRLIWMSCGTRCSSPKVTPKSLCSKFIAACTHPDEQEFEMQRSTSWCACLLFLLKIQLVT